jgi:hypothetical protein
VSDGDARSRATDGRKGVGVKGGRMKCFLGSKFDLSRSRSYNTLFADHNSSEYNERLSETAT